MEFLDKEVKDLRNDNIDKMYITACQNNKNSITDTYAIKSEF